tara:strand:+ start:1156 stop:1500 length:345 start_codon:yes stop_codon:yes gene_type:complete
LQEINEEKLETPIVDLTAARTGKLDESYLTALGGIIKYIMRRMFNPGSGPGSFRIRGSRSEADAFLKALGAEKKYIDSFMSHGLDNPMTYKNSRKLAGASRAFTQATGLKWPFK